MAGNGLEERVNVLANKMFAQSDEMGALPTLYAATVPDIPPGAYAGPDGLLERAGHPKLVGHDERREGRGGRAPAVGGLRAS